MARIKFESNVAVSEDAVKIISKNLVKAVSRVTGEPESEMRVSIFGNVRMRMAAAENAAIAHIEIRDVQISKDRARELTQAICPVVEEALNIVEHNLYIAVVNPGRNSMWRVNGDLGKTEDDGKS